MFYENYYINLLSWKLIISLLSQSGAVLLLLTISYLSIMAFMMKYTETEVTSLLWEGCIACSGFLTASHCVIYLHSACAGEFSERWDCQRDPLLWGWFPSPEVLCWCIAQHWMHQYNTLLYKIPKHSLSLCALQPSVLCHFSAVCARKVHWLPFLMHWTVVAWLNCPWASAVK